MGSTAVGAAVGVPVGAVVVVVVVVVGVGVYCACGGCLERRHFDDRMDHRLLVSIKPDSWRTMRGDGRMVVEPVCR